jgi:predicted metal-dependent hydrolase
VIGYTLTRSRRRTVAIHIKNGGIEVRAPMKTPKRDIDKFVVSKEKWITERLAQSQANAEKR